ncbi:MAG: AAA family ATPase, partial [Promethearchaeota archaeon]
MTEMKGLVGDIEKTKSMEIFPILDENKEVINDFKNKIKLEKIILEDFISFDYNEVIFHPEFTIITGPNGVGKSSIYHALKFVLGSNDYDGRYKKWSNFIRTGQKYAIVTLYLKFSGKNYCLRRTVFKDRTPKFSFQGSDEKELHDVSAKTIQEFVDKIGIDPNHVFSFMSQGKIGSLKNFKDEALCSFVEKGLGLNILREKILYQKEKIDYLKKEYSALISRRDSLKYQLVELEPKLKRLEKKRSLLNKLERLDNELLWAQKEDIIKQIEVYRDQIQFKEDSIKDLDLEINSLQEEEISIEGNLKQIKDEYKDKINNISKKEARLEILKEEINKWTSEKNQIADKIDKISKDIEKLQLDLNKQDFELKSYQKSMDDLIVLTKEAKILLKSYEDEERSLNKKFIKFREILFDYNSKTQIFSNLKDNLKDLEETQNKKESEINEKAKDIQKIDHELKDFKWFMENPKKDLQIRMKDLMEKYQNTINIFIDDLNQLQEQYKRLTGEIERVKQSVHDKSMPKPRSIISMMDEIKQRNMQSIGPLIDYITFDPLEFSQLKNMAQRYNARCNLYLEKQIKITPLPILQDSSKIGVFGYLAEKIKPTIPDPAIQKVIRSVASITLVVKDHIAGTNFTQRFNSKNWIVTLDGEQLRPKKFVLEARPFISNNKRKITSVAQAKLILNELTGKSETNRQNYNKRSSDLQKIKEKHKKLMKNLGEIDVLLVKYKQKEITTNVKNALINEREINYSKIQEKKREIEDINKEIKILKDKLPDDSILNHNRLDQLPSLIDDQKNKISEYEAKKDINIQQINDIKIAEKLLTNEINSKTKEKQEIVSDLTSQDKHYYELFKENIKLTDEIKIFKNEIKDINEKTDSFESELRKTIEEKNKLLIRKATIINSIDEIKSYIEEKEKKIEIISNMLKEIKQKNFPGRSIIEIQNDIEEINKILRSYIDVDENIILEKQRI